MARREGKYVYELLQLLQKANMALRDAEDLARMEQPAWPTADRIRSIHEQVTFDVVNGSTKRPPIMQQLTELVAWAADDVDYDTEVERLAHGICDVLDMMENPLVDQASNRDTERAILRGLLIGTTHEGHRDP